MHLNSVKFGSTIHFTIKCLWYDKFIPMSTKLWVLHNLVTTNGVLRLHVEVQ